MLFHMIHLYFCVVDVQKFCRNEKHLRRNGPKEFKIPSVDRADKVLPLQTRLFTSFTGGDFFFYLKKVDP